MKNVSEETLLAFLAGDLADDERQRLLDALEESPRLAARMRAAAAGWEGVSAWAAAKEEEPRRARRIPVWWLPAAMAASVLVAVPTTLALAGSPSAPPTLEGAPASADPSYVIVLHGRWPDAPRVGPAEATRRAEEYWAWAGDLAERGLLVAAGDLRWEPGLRLAAAGVPVEPPETVITEPDFLVGMFTIRAATYEEAAAIADDCPHLSYGGSVSVRRVGAGFVTVPGMGDWSGD